MPTLAKTIFELSRIFKCLNEKFYSGELEQPLITVQSKGKHPALGWCSSRQIWKKTNAGDTAYYEINFSAEYLTRNSDEIIETMLHEMAHLYGSMKGIQTTSRGGTYHNKKYKAIAEEHGLYVEETEKYGWSLTGLTDATREKVKDIKPNKQAFKVYREGAGTGKPKEKKKSSTRKYVCPNCGAIIRATKDIEAMCLECMPNDIKMALKAALGDKMSIFKLEDADADEDADNNDSDEQAIGA